MELLKETDVIVTTIDQHILTPVQILWSMVFSLIMQLMTNEPALNAWQALRQHLLMIAEQKTQLIDAVK